MCRALGLNFSQHQRDRVEAMWLDGPMRDEKGKPVYRNLHIWYTSIRAARGSVVADEACAEHFMAILNSFQLRCLSFGRDFLSSSIGFQSLCSRCIKAPGARRGLEGPHSTSQPGRTYRLSKSMSMWSLRCLQGIAKLSSDYLGGSVVDAVALGPRNLYPRP